MSAPRNPIPWYREFEFSQREQEGELAFPRSKATPLARRHVRVRERETWDALRSPQPSPAEDPPWRNAQTATSPGEPVIFWGSD